MQRSEFRNQIALTGSPSLFREFRAHVGVGHKNWKNGEKSIEEEMVFWGIGDTQEEAKQDAKRVLSHAGGLNEENAVFTVLPTNQLYRQWDTHVQLDHDHDDPTVVYGA